MLSGRCKLYNEGNELVADGTCEVDTERGSVTLRPTFDTPTISRQHGLLRLEMEDGAEFYLSDRVIRFRLHVPGLPPGAAYRLFLTTDQRLRLGGNGGGR